MADADEEFLQNPANASVQPEVDLSDETQDFRFLNNLNIYADSGSLPRRGEKDFEPNPTEHQTGVLSESRRAMHNALSFPRLHSTKAHVIAFYAPDGYTPLAEIPPPKAPQQTDKSTESAEKPARPTPRSANINPDVCVYVPNPKGPFFKSVGQSDRWNRLWLLPEEALYLIERGSLDIRWPSPTDPAIPGEDGLSIPMSLQAAWASFIGHGGLTLERYSVYSGLKRLGYTLARAPGWCDEAEQREHEQNLAPSPSYNENIIPKLRGAGLAGILGSLFNWIHDPYSTASTTSGPMIGTGINRHYMDVYRKLAIIPWYDPITASPSNPSDTTAPFRVVFHVWKPSTPVKKSAPPTPEFRVAVLSTRDQTTMPNMTQLGALLESTPLDPPSGEKMERMMYMRLRHGYRNVILAVVDQGVVSYLRVADSAFGKEKLYENQGGPRGPKRGGRGYQKSKKR
ncbi:unnamed protein product [Penicillium salamii]|uniref:tRNA-splicing endonuclease subunit Sen54 N-terminal domain-containing protein n=1 Tax=Penicillium salamii TaxID=1612424 RepID=A0A9W4N866_9EURO|nr:unnamed protein product [Penicillium salamii]CAG8134662.1 unnamed protein product [Penicillium salamii]CAG8257934.1 unnamed protein product [Penicillium salamii]CAG8311979.1 unnamed protein product [Penicillium salamii]CAG8319562.1 unnamed protein product [Penicillium salamii]